MASPRDGIRSAVEFRGYITAKLSRSDQSIDRPDAQTMLSQLSRCFEDDNKIHPHKTLRQSNHRHADFQPEAQSDVKY